MSEKVTFDEFLYYICDRHMSINLFTKVRTEIEMLERSWKGKEKPHWYLKQISDLSRIKNELKDHYQKNRW